MKKAVIVILAVAILGSLSIYSNKHKAGGSALAPATSAAASQTSGSSTTSQNTTAGYKDGTYTGSQSDNPYGTVQVAAVISGGKITEIKFLQMPYQEGHSQEITSYAEPLLKQSALSKQNAHVDFVSGATDTSYAFEQSLQAALDQAAQS